MARLSIRLQPRASANEVVGWEGDAIKVRLTAPPVEGKANKALVEFLAERLGLSKSAVAVITGHGARNKIVEVTGVDEAEALARLGVGGKRP
ncbi:MAG: DUF167 domain-containing protein [Chloroflexota bacterium]